MHFLNYLKREIYVVDIIGIPTALMNTLSRVINYSRHDCS